MTKLSISFRLLLVFAAGSMAIAQAPPAVTVSPDFHPFTLPDVQGSLHYSISGSDRTTIGYNGSDATSSAVGVNAELGYLSQSMIHPFSMVYSGGYIGGTFGQPSSVFQALALSQVLAFRRAQVILSDSLSYLPQTASSGLSGVPGLGDTGLDPVQVGPDSGLGILTRQSTRINNAASIAVQQPVAGKTTVEGTASETLLRYTGANSSANAGTGGDTTQSTFGGGFNHRIDARTAYTGNYSGSKVTFGGSDLSFLTQSIQLGVSRQFTRKLAVDINVGPQRTSGSAVATSSINLFANIGATYTSRSSGMNINYSSGTNSGSGVTTGARSQSFQATAHRMIGRSLSISLDGRYARSTSLPSSVSDAFTTDSTAADLQINRPLRRNLSLYLSYSAQNQTIQGTGLSSNSLSGLSQIISTGLTYTPQSIRIGRR